MTARLFLAALACYVCLIVGVQLGMRSERLRQRETPVAPPTPAPPLECPEAVAVELGNGANAIRITTSPLGHMVVASPGDGRKYLMLRVADDVAKEAR